MENYKIGDKFTKENYKEIAKFCNEKGYVIKEVKKGNLFEITEQPKETIIDEYYKLKFWFNEDYPKQEQKLRRLNTLKLLTDDNKDPYNELIKLYNQAEEYRKRIQFLEEHDE